MRSPTAAQVWEIWSRHRGSISAIVGITLVSWLVDFSQGVGRLDHRVSHPTPLNELLGMVSFLALFGVFGYTDGSRGKSLGGFPRRLHTLPVSSLRLVAVPVLAGISSVELLYLVWMERLSRDGSTSPLFIGVLLATFMVFYQTGLWTLERFGPLRLVVVGAIGIALVALSFVPSYPGEPSILLALGDRVGCAGRCTGRRRLSFCMETRRAPPIWRWTQETSVGDSQGAGR